MHTEILKKSGLFQAIFSARTIVKMSRTFWLHLISFELVCFILSTLWLYLYGLSINYCSHFRILTYCTKWNVSFFRFKQFISPGFPKKSWKLSQESFCFPLVFLMNPYTAAAGTEKWDPFLARRWFPPGSFARIWWFFLRIFKLCSLNFVQESGLIFVVNHNKFRIAQKSAKTIDNTHLYVLPFQWGKVNPFASHRRELQRTAAENGIHIYST